MDDDGRIFKNVLAQKKRLPSEFLLEKYKDGDGRKPFVIPYVALKSSPSIPLDPNSKIPIRTRQFVLNGIVDMLKAFNLEKDAISIEKEIYTKSSNSSVYKVNYLKWKRAFKPAINSHNSSELAAEYLKNVEELSKLLLSEEDLIKNHFPGYFRFDDTYRTHIQCDRCTVALPSSSNCYHHPGKLFKRSKNEPLAFLCCEKPRNSEHCSELPYHVYSCTRLPFDDLSKIEWWILPDILPNQNYCPKLVALDCEMIYTEVGGSSVARISMVDYASEQVLIDCLIKPESKIIDYNTRYSGITPGSYDSASVSDLVFFDEFKKQTQSESSVQRTNGYLTFDEMKILMCKYLNSSDIILGHGLENDLTALRLKHSKIIDTAVLFLDPVSQKKRSLERLVALNCQLFIQNSTCDGHSSIEDSVACIKLLKYSLQNHKL